MLMPNILQVFGLEIILTAEAGYLWIKSFRNRKTATLSAFFRLCTAQMLFLLVNIPVRFSDLGLAGWDPWLVFLLNAAYIALQTVTACEWFKYFLAIQDYDLKQKSWLRITVYIPLILIIILLALSYKTHWLFYVNENGMYTRGALFALQVIIPYFYIAASFVSAFLGYGKNRDKRIFRIIITAFLCSMGGSVLQILYSGSFGLAGISLAVTLIYIEMFQYELKQIEKMKDLDVVNKKLAVANEKLNETVRELEISVANEKAANNAKNEFLSRMSHDIRTPLNGILGIIEIDDRHPDDIELLSENRKKAKTAANHLVSLINDVLDMSKLSSGKMELSHEPFVISDLIDEVLDISHTSAEHAGITLINENENDTFIYPTTYGSPLHIKRILLNIVGNAIKYNKENGSVSIRLDHGPAENDNRIKYIVTVSDTGIGMSEKFISHLFEPFSQERIDARSVYDGTGLGMAITKTLVDKMCGTIDVESKEGIGSKFTIGLTFDIAHEEAEMTAAGSTDTRLDGIRILLTEDNELNIDIAQTLLEDYGATVDVAENGQIAVDKFTSEPENTYDVILMDCMMPVLDGYDATRAIRALDRPDAASIPILAMTANAFADDVKKCLGSGMNDHLAKPFDIVKVVTTINKYKNRP